MLFEIVNKNDVNAGNSVPDLVNWSTTVGKTKISNPIITNIEKEKSIIGYVKALIIFCLVPIESSRYSAKSLKILDRLPDESPAATKDI